MSSMAASSSATASAEASAVPGPGACGYPAYMGQRAPLCLCFAQCKSRAPGAAPVASAVADTSAMVDTSAVADTTGTTTVCQTTGPSAVAEEVKCSKIVIDCGDRTTSNVHLCLHHKTLAEFVFHLHRDVLAQHSLLFQSVLSRAPHYPGGSLQLTIDANVNSHIWFPDSESRAVRAYFDLMYNPWQNLDDFSISQLLDVARLACHCNSMKMLKHLDNVVASRVDQSVHSIATAILHLESVTEMPMPGTSMKVLLERIRHLLEVKRQSADEVTYMDHWSQLSDLSSFMIWRGMLNLPMVWAFKAGDSIKVCELAVGPSSSRRISVCLHVSGSCSVPDRGRLHSAHWAHSTGQSACISSRISSRLHPSRLASRLACIHLVSHLVYSCSHDTQMDDNKMATVEDPKGQSFRVPQTYIHHPEAEEEDTMLTERDVKAIMMCEKQC